MEGLVIKSTGSWYDVKLENGQIVKARVRGKFKNDDLQVTNPVAVGDKVKLEFEADGNGIISQILPRTNYLIRRSTRKEVFGQILASNIDQAVLVATLAFPRTSLGFIDRFLVSSESFRIPSVLLLNKHDLWDGEQFETADWIRRVYSSIGTTVIFVSAKDGFQLNILKEQLQGRTSLIAGHSGVGKSTILNALDPHILQKTSEVSSFANKGIHTTTFAEMFFLDQNTAVVDTPGIKELGLIDIYDEEISHFFPEMRNLFGQCKYYNCTHHHEPGCAVIKAVESGEISESRYRSYLSMFDEEDNRR
jgi:ribosome biogenesis GTPase / thiamine phosphate phosphatase